MSNSQPPGCSGDPQSNDCELPAAGTADYWILFQDVVNVVSRQGYAEGDIGDATHDAIAAARNRNPRLPRIQNIFPFLVTAVARQLHRRASRRSRETSFGESAILRDYAAVEKDLLTSLIHAEEIEAMKSCIKALPKKDRELLVLRYHHCIAVIDLARRQLKSGADDGDVAPLANDLGVRLHRIRKKLKECGRRKGIQD